MEKFYLKLEQANSVEIQVYPFTENDIFVFFDLETSIKITNAYIRIFGNEETNSDFVTCITEEGLYNFKILKQLSELFNLPFERDINELSIAFPECDCTVLIDDEGGSTFQTKNGYENLLKRIEVNQKQYHEASLLSKIRSVPFGDALNAIVARDLRI